ncbi:MAG: hypothetical protein DME00_18960 [Candidatus Rokuibacteriota bacterium]|nr:MAG: hypothetical protein DME00_18960 [Candidatus Rokubacteria bacterium]PYO05695.1 MAG: hypothetical protein DMD75_27090 [Candidatus Rokubacteria bacterium]
MRAPRLRLLGFALTWLVVATGCATTRIVSQWSSPEYAAPRFDKIMVIGITRQPSIRRSFEDEFVARLKATGVDAVPSYRFIPEDGPVEEARLTEAVKQAGADATIMTRLVKVEKKTRVSPGIYQPAPAAFGFYPGYAGAWFGYYEPPTYYQYDVYVSETSLYDVKKNQLVWSGTVETEEPRDIRKEIARYVDTVIDALKTRNLLAAR